MSTGKAMSLSLAPSFAPMPNLAAQLAAQQAAQRAAEQAIFHAVAVATPVVLAAAAAAGAVFLTRAALDGLAGYADREEELAGLAAAERSEVLAWDRAFAELTVRNARITRLEALGATLGADEQPPAPFVYQGQTREQAYAWCTATDVTLKDAEQRLTAERIRAALAQPLRDDALTVRERVERRLVPVPPRPAPVAPDPYPPGLIPPDPTPSGPSPLDPAPSGPAPSGPTVPDPGTPPASPPDRRPIDLQPVVDEILRGALTAVSPADFTRLTEKAADVLAQDGARAAKAQLDELYLLTQDARDRQRRRAADAAEAARRLVGLTVLEQGPTPLPTRQREVIDALRAVAAEQRELDAALRADVEDLAALARRAAHDRAISTAFARELEALGYTVEIDDHGPARPVHLGVTRPEWGATHRADLDIQAGELTAAFATDGTAERAGRADLHHATWADHVEAAQAAARAAGVSSGKVRMTDDPRTRRAATDADTEYRAHVPKLQERETPR